MTLRILLLLLCCSWLSGNAQDHPLTYYLPDITYDAEIPTPKEYLGWQIGDWHISHDLLQGYMKLLAEKSDRLEVEEYARSHEGRPLLGLICSSAANQKKLATIKDSRGDILYGKGKTDRPVVIYQGYSIHGNESSGANAAVLMAYYLAAGQSAEVKELLTEAVVIIDPCLNPDGLNRFASWANTHKSKVLNPDTNGREFGEAWPGGRTNHYWFDLNRDWLPLVHPESQGRLRMFHTWKPNILTDHHEMGSNNTFFFQPGIPSRTNPITPQKNQDLTVEIGNYHAAELDKLGSLYYSQESFDDFYYGKGSTYPDVNGCIGILFEQASSRGHLRETNNGLMSFPFTIRNQVAVSISTQKAGLALRKELKSYQDDFYGKRSASSEVYVIEEKYDRSRLENFVALLLQHQIEVYSSGDTEYVVPIDQPQHLLIETIFEKNTSFRDSLFYDVSTWTMPLAYNLQATKKSGVKYSKAERVKSLETAQGIVTGKSAYGYVFAWDDYYSPRLLYALQRKGLRTKVASRKWRMQLDSRTIDFDYGSIIIPVQNQSMPSEEIHDLLKEQVAGSFIKVYPLTTGMGVGEVDLGSPSMKNLRMPKVMMVVEESTSAYEAGEVWHLLDQYYDMPITLMPSKKVNDITLQKYNTVVLVHGSNPNSAALKAWVKRGGVLITCKGASAWAVKNGLSNTRIKDKAERKNNKRSTYAKASRERGAQYVGGAIFESQLDLSHPLCYGYHNSTLPLFKRGTLAFELPDNVYATPILYHDKPLLSGYISTPNLSYMQNSAAAIVSGLGSGSVISFADNPNFRGFWLGSSKLFANAIFFGNTIDRATAAYSKPKN